ncbi:MAG TPA: guanosine-3',5'-bis(diphosphate) 3'-diphosphatase, partial [Gammaproteobacteria bacterium]|nr:guanosine-3',5'-bis(diphosphate) 3'-diphosphatase [Gammaproteobacteria bacterium]
MPTTPATKRRKSPSAESRQRPAKSSKGRLLISDLLEVVEQYLDPEEIKAVYDAYLFGAEAHEGQTRRSGEAYIFHPLSVAAILSDIRLDSRSIIAALLHDVIEDTPTAKEELATRFGKDVAQLVDGVSKIDQIDFESREHAEAENLRKMLLAMAKDIRVILIKLADRLHNMRTLDALKPEKRKRIAAQTLDIFAPIANRLGMRTWTQELEDLSFLHLYPKRYDAIHKELGKRRGNHRAIIQKTVTKFEAELSEAGIEGSVEGREKNIYSVYRKMRSRRVPMSEMRDIFAIRVIVRSVDDCYRVLGVIHNTYKPVPGKFKDYIAIPKANGYQSLHTLLFGTFGQSIEVQIRTTEMHRIAESGVASHWQYKTGEKRSGSQTPAHHWLLDLLNTQDQAGNPSEFLEHLKIDLYPDEVYVFTPHGDIKKLPKGSSALDFAYSVHSDVGNHCIGARINNEPVPLHQPVVNGDHVEILTARSAVPTPLWLNYVVTAKARAAIRDFLKHQHQEDAGKLGRQLLERALKTVGLTTRLRTDQKIQLLKHIGLEDWNELLTDIGMGRRLPMVVARQLLPESKGADSAKSEPLPIRGVEGMSVSYARCCRPIP